MFPSCPEIASDVVSGSMIDHAIHGFYRHNRNNSHTFDIYLLPIREVAVTSRPYRGFGPKLEGCRIVSDLMNAVLPHSMRRNGRKFLG